MTYSGRFQYSSQLFIGAILLLMGTALLFNNLNLIDVGLVWKHWPLFVIAVGLGKFVQAGNTTERGRGIWWIFVGTWLYISVTKFFGFGFRDSWPILLVGWGVSLVWKSLVPQQARTEKENYHG